jgi:hypothetical protein
MYSIRPVHWNIKSSPASSGRSHGGPAFYIFSLLGDQYAQYDGYTHEGQKVHVGWFSNVGERVTMKMRAGLYQDRIST